MKKLDLTNLRFGRLVVLCESGKSKDGQICWKCMCDCGNLVTVTGGHLRSGHTKSCGCFFRESTSKRRRTHGNRNSRLYRIWSEMKGRCVNENCKAYKYYGGKGVTVCKEWFDSFQVFYDWAMDNGYQDNLTIDRIENDGNYEPSNCRWITLSEQQSNRSNNRRLKYDGETHNIKEWAEKYGVEYFKFYGELKAVGFDLLRWNENRCGR